MVLVLRTSLEKGEVVEYSMHWSCLRVLEDGLMINPFSACTQPSILVRVIKTKSTRKGVVSGGGKQEQVRLTKRPKAITKSYISRWRGLR